MLKNKKTQFRHLGTIDYKEAWDYQEELFSGIVNSKIENRKNNALIPTENYLLFCNHPNVYTLGKSGDPQNLLLSQKELESKNISYYKINRGGDITYHGPGQIVGYPILDLDNFFTDIHKYLRYLEEAIILTLGDYQVQSGRIDGLTGVWLDPEDPAKARKIAALGVRTSRWVTLHGFAFNVNVDLKYFDYIVPCGIEDKAVTSLKKELGYELPMEEVEGKLKSHLVDLFDMELINL